MYWELYLFFLGISFVYAAVGFGGGSSYLALLAIYGMPYQELRLTALVCNVIVVTGSVFVHLRVGQLNWRRTLPLVAASVPMAYLGAVVKISQHAFFCILGISLLAAAVLLWMEKKTEPDDHDVPEKKPAVKSAIWGSGIGFLSGMVGIGGGIFLSPVLNLARWDTAKKIAATASLFILVNSIAGIAGQWKQSLENVDVVRMSSLCMMTLIGGQLGANLAISWEPLVIKRVTAILVLIAGVNVLAKNIPFIWS